MLANMPKTKGKKPVAKKKKAAAPKKKEGAREILEALDVWLEKCGLDQRVVYSKPIAASAVSAAEKKLGMKLPSSYVDFVTKHGTFEISGELTGRGFGNDTALLAPAEAVKETLRYRKELAKAGDADGREILDDGLLFCADPRDEAFFLFVLSSAKGGDMRTRLYDYQNPGLNDPHHDGDGTFDSVVDEIAMQVLANTE